jgi:uncharacterized Fe-S cluster-containing protein
MTRSAYKLIADNIRKAVKSQDKDILANTLLILKDQLESYQRALEIRNKKCCSLEERYLEILDVDSGTSKITINAVTGRFTLKVGNKSSENVKQQFIKLITEIMSEEELPAVTLRGKVEFYSGGYQTSLISESKKFKYFKRIEEKVNE